MGIFVLRRRRAKKVRKRIERDMLVSSGSYARLPKGSLASLTHLRTTPVGVVLVACIVIVIPRELGVRVAH